MEHQELLQEISTFLQKGRSPKVKELVQEAIDSGLPPKSILEEGLLAGMGIIEIGRASCRERVYEAV